MFLLWAEQSRGRELLHSPFNETSFFGMEKGVGCKDWSLGREVQKFGISGKTLDSLSSSGAQASSSTPDYYMFGTLGKVVNSTDVIRVQVVLRATSSTTGKSVANLRA